MDWLPLSYFYTNTELTNSCVSITWMFGSLKIDSSLQLWWYNGVQMTQIHIKPSKYRRNIWYSDNACDGHLSSRQRSTGRHARTNGLKLKLWKSVTSQRKSKAFFLAPQKGQQGQSAKDKSW